MLADPAAYLELIDQSDPQFMQEQTMWAADLDANTPEFFEMTIGESLTLDPDGARCKVTLAWTMPNAATREISYPALFTLANDGWRYAGEDWSAHQIEKLRVLYFEDELLPVAQTIGAVFPEIRERIDTVFDAKLDHLQTVKLYSSMRHLQASIYLSYTEALDGWNEPGESIKIRARAKTSQRGLRPLLAHEYGHVAMFAMGDHATQIPWWAQEGVAQLAADANPDSAVQRWAKSDKLLDWSLMADFRKTDPKHFKYVYTQGHHMVAFVREQHGDQAWVNWIRSMAQGSSLDQSTLDNLQLSFEDLDRQWRDSLPKPVAQPQDPQDEPQGKS